MLLDTVQPPTLGATMIPNRNQIRIAAASVLPAVATMLFVQACGGGGDARAQAAADPMEGIWEITGTVRNCATNSTIATFRAADVMHRGGTLTDTNAGPPTARGPGFGVWSRNADGTYSVKIRNYRYNADGSFAGTNVLTSTRMLSADANTYSGETRNDTRDAAGAVLSTVCVTEAGARF